MSMVFQLNCARINIPKEMSLMLRCRLREGTESIKSYRLWALRQLRNATYGSIDQKTTDQKVEYFLKKLTRFIIKNWVSNTRGEPCVSCTFLNQYILVS